VLRIMPAAVLLLSFLEAAVRLGCCSCRRGSAVSHSIT
jgi:hypothetical protein